MSDELVNAIATALSAQGRELIVAGSKGALTSLFSFIRERFNRDPNKAEVLDSAINRPGDQPGIDALSGLLTNAMAQDPEFAAQVLSYWRDAAGNGPAGSDAVMNNFIGSANKVVQIRDVQGGVSL